MARGQAMVEIDGRRGEGGGQMLRSALTLSILTGRAVRFRNVRARRPKPGLRAQHLTAVRAAASVARAEVEGAVLGSTSLVFRPGEAVAGEYRFEIGTAGSTCLVLQTVFLPLVLAGGPSSVTVTGGTHVPGSPSFEYLEWHWLHFLGRLGCRAELRLEQAGFYPRGGGALSAQLLPAGSLAPLVVRDRGRLLGVDGFSAVANLDDSIAERQRRTALARLERQGIAATIDLRRLPARSAGTELFLRARFERSQCCTFALGARGKPAEEVGEEAVEALESFLASPAAVDPFLADQLLLPLAFASGRSVLRTSRITRHLLTNAEVLSAFVPVEIEIEGRLEEPGLISVGAG